MSSLSTLSGGKTLAARLAFAGVCAQPQDPQGRSGPTGEAKRGDSFIPTASGLPLLKVVVQAVAQTNSFRQYL